MVVCCGIVGRGACTQSLLVSVFLLVLVFPFLSTREFSGLTPQWITPSEICRILHILRKPNSIIALSVKWVKPWSQDWLIAAGAYPSFCSMKRLEVFLLPLRRSLSQQFSATHLYTWVERGTVRVKCLVQEHNTMSQARARTRTAGSGVERTNQKATVPPVTFFVFPLSKRTQPCPQVFLVNGSIICSGLHFLRHFDIIVSIIFSGLYFWSHWFNIWSTAAGCGELCVRF